MKKSMAIMVSLTALAVSSVPAHAVTTYDDLGAWQAAVGSYNRDTSYGTTLDDISSLTLDDGTALGFGSSVNIRAIGDGWATWSGGYTGQVLYTNGASSLSGTVSPVGGFGFFIEGNPFDVRTFTLLLSDGSTESGSYSGSSGAGFLGFVGSGITGFTVSSDVDFAFGDFYTTSGAVPEPATWAMMLAGFGAVGFAMRRRRQNVAVSFA